MLQMEFSAADYFPCPMNGHVYVLHSGIELLILSQVQRCFRIGAYSHGLYVTEPDAFQQIYDPQRLLSGR